MILRAVTSLNFIPAMHRPLYSVLIGIMLCGQTIETRASSDPFLDPALPLEQRV